MRIAGKTVKEYYESGCSEREPYLRRARDVASLTLPALMPPDGWAAGQTLGTPFQSMGSRGVSSLASKLLLALFPPNQSFARLELDAGAEQALQGGGSSRSEVEASLAGIERSILREVEAVSLRPHLHEVMKHLIACGNVCLYIPPEDSDEGRVKVTHLDRFIVKRDPAGNILGLVIKESISAELLPESLKHIVTTKPDSAESATFDIYTAAIRDGKKFHVWQEVEGEVVPDSEGVFAPKDLPWLVLRMEPVSGQSYGYGYAASVLGDLGSLEGLWQGLVESSAVAAKTLFLVNPTSSTRIEELVNAPNGGFVTGNPDDVVTLKVEKAADMQISFQAIEHLQKSLGFAFLLNQSVQRSGERVTAEEIRFLAQELEDVLAGTYSLLSQELQLRLVHLILKRLESKGIPKLKGIARPSIITGLEALGRGHDLMKLDTFVQGAGQTLGPDGLNRHLNAGEYLRRRATAVGLNSEGLIRSDEEIQEMDQQQAQAQLTQTATPEVIRQAGKAMTG